MSESGFRLHPQRFWVCQIEAGRFSSPWPPYYSGVERSCHPLWLLTGLPTLNDDDGDVKRSSPHIPTNSASFPPSFPRQCSRLGSIITSYSPVQESLAPPFPHHCLLAQSGSRLIFRSKWVGEHDHCLTFPSLLTLPQEKTSVTPRKILETKII